MIKVSKFWKWETSFRTKCFCWENDHQSSFYITVSC